ncbi:MarR family transcriptional regulator [Pseudooceanicola sediminis]|uniref:MarR family transcriptional regulator n=1 Tax=Pseudooceanicola sediminis TaxID=2211117 RepID=A0A399IXR0_9RHOB|nr:MarR family transcriptional regulator [Pseudooceanicola sediminis]RII37958.1 MarR family transcriptional regulator [Pseudooceanicola sediminis]|tara:strand:+ start:9876 stop:10319 length:444 start_codon:yes stop_codon:yes gene_type:complete
MTQRDSRETFYRNLVTLTRKVRTLFDARTSSHGLTYARARLLLHMNTCEAQTQAELAEAMDVERPTMARLIDGLEEAGLVRREISSQDRRQRHVHMTAPARAQAQTVTELTEAIRHELIEGIPEEDLEVADRVIHQMLENIVKAASE